MWRRFRKAEGPRQRRVEQKASLPTRFYLALSIICMVLASTSFAIPLSAGSLDRADSICVGLISPIRALPFAAQRLAKVVDMQHAKAQLLDLCLKGC